MKFKLTMLVAAIAAGCANSAVMTTQESGKAGVSASAAHPAMILAWGYNQKGGGAGGGGGSGGGGSGGGSNDGTTTS